MSPALPRTVNVVSLHVWRACNLKCHPLTSSANMGCICCECTKLWQLCLYNKREMHRWYMKNDTLFHIFRQVNILRVSEVNSVKEELQIRRMKCQSSNSIVLFLRYPVCLASSTWPAWLASLPPALCFTSSANQDADTPSFHPWPILAPPTSTPLTWTLKLCPQPRTSTVVSWPIRAWTATPNHSKSTNHIVPRRPSPVRRYCVSGAPSSLRWVTYTPRLILTWKLHTPGLPPPSSVPAVWRCSPLSSAGLGTPQHL